MRGRAGAAGAVAVGPVSIGPVSIGPVFIGAIAVRPIPIRPVAAASVAPIPVIIIATLVAAVAVPVWLAVRPGVGARVGARVGAGRRTGIGPGVGLHVPGLAIAPPSLRPGRAAGVRAGHGRCGRSGRHRRSEGRGRERVPHGPGIRAGSVLAGAWEVLPGAGSVLAGALEVVARIRPTGIAVDLLRCGGRGERHSRHKGDRQGEPKAGHPGSRTVGLPQHGPYLRSCRADVRSDGCRPRAHRLRKVKLNRA